MCSVKFKEWIVVLATLLRRSEVHLDSFLQALVSKIVGSCIGIVGVLLGLRSVLAFMIYEKLMKNVLLLGL